MLLIYLICATVINLLLVKQVTLLNRGPRVLKTVIQKHEKEYYNRLIAPSLMQSEVMFSVKSSTPKITLIYTIVTMIW